MPLHDSERYWMTPKRGGPVSILGYSMSHCGGQIWTGTGFSPNQSISPLSIIPLTYDTHINSNITLKRQAGKAWERSSNAIFFHISRNIGKENNLLLFHLCCLFKPDQFPSLYLVHLTKFCLASKPLYQKDRRSQTGNIQSSKIFLLPCNKWYLPLPSYIVFLSLSSSSPSLLLLSLSLSPPVIRRVNSDHSNSLGS